MPAELLLTEQIFTESSRLVPLPPVGADRSIDKKGRNFLTETWLEPPESYCYSVKAQHRSEAKTGVHKFLRAY